MLVLALACVLYLLALGKTPLRIEAEKRCHAIVEGMLTSGDYLMPRLPGKWFEPERVERVNKPPLFYWLSALSCRLHGAMDLFWFRLPSALAALGTLALVLTWGREMKSPAVGLVAAVLLGLMYVFVVEARRGTFEMLLTLLSGWAVLSSYRLTQRPGWPLALLATLLFGLGFLTKATPVLLLVPLPLLAWIVATRRSAILKDYRLWTLLLVGLGIGISWHLYLVVFRPESRERLLSEFLLPFGVRVEGTGTNSSASHFGPPWAYFEHIWRIAFPASTLLPLAAIWTWRRWFFLSDPPWLLLLLNLLVPFMVFSIVPQKQDHYLLPLMPPLALLLAGAAVDAVATFRGRQRLWFVVPALLMCLVILGFSAATALGLPLVADLPGWIGVVGASITVTCCCILLWQMIRGDWARVLAAASIGAWMGWLAYFAFIRPVEDNFGSGEIFRDPNFNEAAWNAKFERFPYLKVLLDVHRGEKRAGR